MRQHATAERAGADAAAERAGVTVVALETAAQQQAADALLSRVWRMTDGGELFPRDVMSALAYTGGYVGGAYTGDTLVGVAVGFCTPANSLHSHIAGVIPEAQGRGVGLALKLHQRDWAAEHGMTSVSWTFDPLIRRNAYFNLNRLGATAKAYVPDFYGPLADGINDGDVTDRLFVSWSLDATATPPQHVPSETLLDAALDGTPMLLEPTGTKARCATPADIESLRGQNPGQARQWREATRAALFNKGYHITGFTKDGWYVLDKEGQA